MMHHRYFTGLLLAGLYLMIISCGVHPRRPFEATALPASPDYAGSAHWAALPDKQDPADRTPCAVLKNEQGNAPVDVFFLYPTTYTGSSRSERQWNGDVNDAALCRKTDDSAILFQASAFNGAGRVFAPYYRQAHLHAFFSKDTASAARALQVAYADVEAAFDYYLKHWNQGRPFIIAGHSQGARHAMYLLRDRIEGTPLQQQLVGAYIVGWPVRKDFFRKLKPCEAPTQTDCFCTWRTWERRYGRRKASQPEVLCTNPLTWTTTEGQYAPKSLNTGGVVRPFCSVLPQLADAEVWRGFLLASKPHFPGSFLFVRKNYHIGDINLYYLNLRENARQRSAAFLQANRVRPEGTERH